MKNDPVKLAFQAAKKAKTSVKSVVLVAKEMVRDKQVSSMREALRVLAEGAAE